MRQSWARTLSAIAAAAACFSAHAGETAWITLGERAFALLHESAPQARTLASRAIAVQLPAAGAAQEPASETVFAVEVDEDRLPELSAAVHSQLRRCGGFIRHDSMAEALATLHRLQTPPQETLAPSYAIDDTAVVAPLLPQLLASNILSTIQSLSDFQNRIYTSSHGVAASDWLFNTWKQLAAGRRDIKVTQIVHPDWPQKSVSLLIRGSGGLAAEQIVLGAHLDSTAPGTAETARAPGADDDASGVASLTEVIRVMVAGNYRPRRSIEFIAYAAEEGGLRGSQQIASRYARLKKPVVGVLQLDMTAYQGEPTDLWIFTDFTNAAQNQFVAALAAAYLPQLTVGYDRCGYACSDHASWTAKGFASSFPFESSFSHDNPTIHSASDTTATFGNQAGHALKFSQLALAFAVELGSD